MEALIVLYEVTSHFVYPFEGSLVLNFLQDLVYCLSEYRVNHLSSDRPQLPNKVSPGLIIVIVI